MINYIVERKPVVDKYLSHSDMRNVILKQIEEQKICLDTDVFVDVDQLSYKS